MCFALRHANWVLANSDNTKDTLKNLIGVDPQNIIIAYPTVDAERFFPDVHSTPTNNRTILCIATVSFPIIGKLQLILYKLTINCTISEDFF
jgi:phosphatidylinositol alpha-1,6-mannosyltransferase